MVPTRLTRMPPRTSRTSFVRRACTAWWWLCLPMGASCAAPREAASGKPTPTEWVALSTGRSCARGRVACGVGHCAANIANHCPTPITCELTVQCICAAYTGENGEALQRASETILPGQEVGVMAQVLCDEGEVVVTHAQRLNCR
ncbi:MAG TPA: hypothetical protein ENK23_02215 [Sorangium sp.]|nr:hypothetical protein [Sorangium sp.]